MTAPDHVRTMGLRARSTLGGVDRIEGVLAVTLSDADLIEIAREVGVEIEIELEPEEEH